MRTSRILLIPLLFLTLGVTADAQRRGRGGSATLAIMVSDSSGTPLSDVKVTLEGPESRQARTERGRIALENLRPGAYRLRFEREGFVPYERDVTARGGAPIDVKVTLTAAPKPAPPPPPPAPPTIEADPVIANIPAFVEKNFVGRDPSRISNLGCATGGTATVIQLRAPLPERKRDDVDEYFYVIGGEGTTTIAGAVRALHAGIFAMIPRGVAYSVTVKGRNPLVLLSIKAGERCASQ